ncbi:MAG: DoxX family protein [Acidobacteria bacterium]|nr:DoxX family protein [Acidobacteriota bacterium]
MRAVFLLGRLLFGGFFVYNGIHHFQQTRVLSEYAGAKKVPKPGIAVRATGALLVAGGSSILLGIKPKLGTMAVLTFLAGVSPVMHDFWRQEEPGEKMNDTINFAKNLALAGGAMALMGVEEPWPASVPVLQPSRRHRIKRLLGEIAA